jgi:hypothetical protein
MYVCRWGRDRTDHCAERPTDDLAWGYARFLAGGEGAAHYAVYSQYLKGLTARLRGLNLLDRVPSPGREDPNWVRLFEG